MGWVDDTFLAADRVIGAKYVSPVSRFSDRVGVGAIMQGEPGIWYVWDMVVG